MALAVYIKDPPKVHQVQNQDAERPRQWRKKGERVFFGLMTAVGAASVAFALWPLFAWNLIILPKLTDTTRDAPIPQGEVLSVSSLVGDVQVVKDPDGFTYFTTDYKPQGPRPKEFYLTIPKLKIKRAKVLVDNLNFYKNLSHFPGSAIPGDVGNSFITGHSVLPQFNDPSDYRAIFTKLSDLEIGDEVLVEIEDKRFNFVVQYAKVVDPHDLSVVSPISPNGRNVTLMTCVPPGTNTKRLVVVTSLI